MSGDRVVFEARELAIEHEREDLRVELADTGSPYGRIFACQGFPRCDRYGTGDACPWCTKIIVRRDGGEAVIEPGRA